MLIANVPLQQQDIPVHFYHQGGNQEHFAQQSHHQGGKEHFTQQSHHHPGGQEHFAQQLHHHQGDQEHFAQQSPHQQGNQEHYAQQSHQAFFYINPYAYAPQANQYLPPKKEERPRNNEYLPPINFNSYLPPPSSTKTDCDSETGASNRIRSYEDNYIGLLPPKITNNHLQPLVHKYRSARSNFNDKNIRLEYGFKPPMVPSLEIDEQGNPIEKDEK